MLSQLHPRIHQIHGMDPGNGGSREKDEGETVWVDDMRERRITSQMCGRRYDGGGDEVGKFCANTYTTQWERE
ncbi:hypothetical protein Tco_0121010 [Tanacetum coccineum]